MPQPAATVVTIRQVADHAGVSVATASYALRNDSRISTATRQRVLASAHTLGYRPNPRVAGLMAHIRGAHPRTRPERIAFVWMQTPPEFVGHNTFLQRYRDGTRRRAEQLGYALDEFWTDAQGMNQRRLTQVLRARGIVGVVFSPVCHQRIVTRTTTGGISPPQSSGTPPGLRSSITPATITTSACAPRCSSSPVSAARGRPP